MKKTILTILLFCCVAAQAQDIKILQLNIWMEGTEVPNGFDAIVDNINQLNPDFVTFSEIQNLNNTHFSDRITTALAAKGKKYYSFYSDDAGLISRYPIIDTATVYYGKGAIYKLVAKIKGKEVAVYSAHLDYENYAVYLPRGYDGLTWKKLKAPVTNLDSVLAMNRASKRMEAINAFLLASKEDIKKGRCIFLGGDFNEASHLDWTEQTKKLFDHNGVIAPWDCSVALYKAGFKDSYRELYPNVVTHPGFTYPSNNTAVAVNKLTWAPDADERERIDFIYYYPSKKIKIKSSAVVAPKGDIIRNERKTVSTQDAFIVPSGTWCTDHKALLSTFKI